VGPVNDVIKMLENASGGPELSEALQEVVPCSLTGAAPGMANPQVVLVTKSARALDATPSKQASDNAATGNFRAAS
jgi:hypothetical protein